MIVYIPTPITSVEQAEALPGNAVIIEKGPRHIDQAFLRHHALAFAEPYPGEGGAIALVPIEAEGETSVVVRGAGLLEAAVDRVREMHKPLPEYQYIIACSCGWWSYDECPTVRALDGT